MRTALVFTSFAAAAADYVVTVREHSPTPVLSRENASIPGGCIVFNPSWIPASATSPAGLLVRQCCGDDCFGHGARGGAAGERGGAAGTNASERIGFAPCDLETGRCEAVLPDFNLDPDADAEDPRAFLYEDDGFFYNFYLRDPPAADAECEGDQCTVQLSRTKTPLDAGSWDRVATLPWHRNGCCALAPVGETTRSRRADIPRTGRGDAAAAT